MAVIGAGILGLTAALALARAGVAVTVLEASEIGAGASGRNGGLVVPSLPRIGPQALMRRLGADSGARLAAMVAGSASTVFDLIRAEAISCEAVQAGWLQPAHAARLAAGLLARGRGWQAAGSSCVWLDAAEARRRLGSARFHGALLDPTGGHLNPLAYTRGLARALLAAGGRLHTATPVLSTSGRFALRTPGGTLRATRVLQCTNGQTPGVGAAVQHSTVPLFVYQLATPVLPDHVRAAMLAGNEAFSDTRNNLLAGRWTAEGRLVTGGMAAWQPGAMARLPKKLARRLAKVFPALAGVTLPRVWRGQAALTGDFVPRLFEPLPGWLAPIACNGRGIALSTALGRALGEALAHDDLSNLPLPIAPPRPIRPRVLARLAPQILLPLGDWQDRRAERR